MKEYWQKILTGTKLLANKLSNREKIIITSGALVGLIIAIVQLGIYISEIIATKRQAVIRLESEAQEAGEKLVKYADLRKKRNAIENQYKKVEIKEGVKTLLEKIIKDKGSPTAPPNIKDLPVVSIGDNYQRAPFTVRFLSTSMDAVAEFLKEVTQGTQPLVLTELTLIKQRPADKIQIIAEVSSIRRISPAPEAENQN